MASQTSQKKQRFLEISIVIVASLIFWYLALSNLLLPGPYQDECLILAPALRYLGVEMISPHDSCCVQNILGNDVLLMINPDYMSAIPGYISLPFFYVFGINAFAMRLCSAVILFGFLLATYAFGKEVLGGLTGALTMLLMAVEPFLIEASRSFAALNYVSLFGLLGLLSLVLWHKHKQNRYLLLSAFLFGIGFSVKIALSQLIFAIIVAEIAYMALSHKKPKIGADTLWLAALSAVSFFFGAILLVLQNIYRKFTTFRLVSSVTGSPTVFGANNLDIIGNISKRISQIDFVLGDLSIAYLITAAWVLYFYFYNPKFKGRVVSITLIVLVVSLIFASAFTITTLSPVHLYILYPFPQMLLSYTVVASAYSLFKILKKKKMGGYSSLAPKLAFFSLPLLLFTVLLLTNLSTCISYQEELSMTGGKGYHTDAIYELSDYLDENNVSRPVALTWGFKYNTNIITQGRVDPLELHFNPERQDININKSLEMWKSNLSKRFFVDGSNRYLFYVHMQEKRGFPEFNTTAEEEGKEVVLEKEFCDRKGTPTIRLYLVLDKN